MHSSTTGGQLSGSDRFRVLGSTGAHLRLSSALRASCRPELIHRLAPTSLLRLGRQPTSIRIELRPSARLATASGLRHMLPPLPRLASTSGLLRLLPPSGFTGVLPLGLRLAIYSPVEPPMHSLLQAEPCIASLAVDEYSVSTGSCIFRNHPAKTNFRLAPSFDLLVRPAIPLRLAPEVSPSVRAGGHPPALTGCSLRPPCWQFAFGLRRLRPLQLPAIHSDALLGHQLNETVRPFNLWKQVQKSSKFVDFTNAGATARFCCATAKNCGMQSGSVVPTGLPASITNLLSPR